MTDAFLTFVADGPDRRPRDCRDPSWITARLHARDARVLPVWRDRNLVLPATDERGPAALALAGDHARGTLHLADEIVYLGERDAVHWFAADLSAREGPDLTPILGRAEIADLRDIGQLMEPFEAILLARARGVLYWHRRNRFCGACGSPTDSEQGGLTRRCRNSACGLEHFPRVDPAVLVHVTRPGPEGGACLLARQPTWPAGLYSCVAGFVEPGETLEQCVRREVREETGIEVGEVTYAASQPWPFPSSLMIGFTAVARTTRLAIDTDEIEDARWVTRARFDRLADLGIRLPRRGTMARILIGQWLDTSAAPPYPSA